MDLYVIIRDWFVQYVWGGTLSNGYSRGTGRIGRFITATGEAKSATIVDMFVPTKGAYFDGSELTYINIGDWLSTTSTIITMVAILLVIAFFIRWIFKVVSNSILLR